MANECFRKMNRRNKRRTITVEVGFAELLVTPPTGTWLGGFSSRTEPSVGVRDDLRAQAAWLRSPEHEHVLIVLDQVGITREWTDALQSRMLEQWGLRADQVLVHWTHTHCAPLYREPTPGFEQAVYPADYFAGLIDSVVDVCRAARADLEPATFSYGSGISDLAVSRRLILEGQNLFAANTYGAVDHEVPVLAAYRADGSCKLVMFSYACHPTMTNDLLVSAEYPGVARRVLEARLQGGVRAMFLQGCSADAVVGVHSSEKERYKLPDQWDDVEAAGRSLAWKVQLILAHKMEPVLGDTLASCTLSCHPTFERFPTRSEIEARVDGEHPGDIRWARYHLQRTPGEPVWPERIEARLHGLRIGDVYLMGHPGEVVSAYGLRLKERHARLRLVTLAYCHAQIGYVPRRSMYDEGGYEVDAWRTWGYPSRWDRSIEQQFESTAEAILSQLQQQR
jgi:neutral ceramidase